MLVRVGATAGLVAALLLCGCADPGKPGSGVCWQVRWESSSLPGQMESAGAALDTPVRRSVEVPELVFRWGNNTLIELTMTESAMAGLGPGISRVVLYDVAGAPHVAMQVEEWRLADGAQDPVRALLGLVGGVEGAALDALEGSAWANRSDPADVDWVGLHAALPDADLEGLARQVATEEASVVVEHDTGLGHLRIANRDWEAHLAIATWELKGFRDGGGTETLRVNWGGQAAFESYDGASFGGLGNGRPEGEIRQALAAFLAAHGLEDPASRQARCHPG